MPGEDSLDISLDAGNTVGTGATSTDSINEFDGNATGDAVNVDGVSYTFPLGGVSVSLLIMEMLVLSSQQLVLRWTNKHTR